MKNIIVVFLILISGFTYGQKKQKSACYYIQKSTEAYCKKDYKSAAKNLNLFVQKYPDHMLSEEARYAVGLSYYESGNYKKAEIEFDNLLLLSNAPEADSFGYNLFDCEFMIPNCRNILIPDYMLNLQHEACIKLAEMNIDNKNFPNASKYIKGATKNYRYFYGCGTNDMQEDIRLGLLNAKYYMAINNIDSALLSMLPSLLEPSAYPILYYSDLVDETVRLLKIKYDQDTLVKVIDDVIEKAFPSSITIDYLHKTTTTYYIYFMNTSIKVAPAYLLNHASSIEEVKVYIRNSDFYNKLTGKI